jgi:hypothetical protein
LSEEDIRNRAYHLWKQAGEPAGKMDTFWYKAEAELLAERVEQGEVPPERTDNLPVDDLLSIRRHGISRGTLSCA